MKLITNIELKKGDYTITLKLWSKCKFNLHSPAGHLKINGVKFNLTANLVDVDTPSYHSSLTHLWFGKNNTYVEGMVNRLLRKYRGLVAREPRNEALSIKLELLRNYLK